jgi:hypothetical protein
MGNFYANYTLRGPSQQAVGSALAGRSAIVTPVEAGCVVVFDQESDEQNQQVIAEMGSWLSSELRCPLLAVLNHDDDILWYQLYDGGELIDEYDSTPGYFHEDEEDSGPAGADAGKLCAAFGASAVAEVEEILRKPALDGEGYTFAFERHAALAGALGISSFGVGTGFRHVSMGELPDGLTEADLLRTDQLVPVIKPGYSGYYKLVLRDEKGTRSRPVGWAPGLWAELECAEGDLSEAFLQAAAVHRAEFRRLGFVELGFKKLTRVLEPLYRDNGGINYLDLGGCHFGQMIYNRAFLPRLNVEKERVVISFTAVFQNDILSCANSVQTPLEPPANHRVVRVESNEVAVVYETFLEQLRRRGEQPRRFEDVPALQAWFDSDALEVLAERVRRGLLVRMSDHEVAVARRKMGAQIQPPEPG